MRRVCDMFKYLDRYLFNLINGLLDNFFPCENEKAHNLDTPWLWTKMTQNLFGRVAPFPDDLRSTKLMNVYILRLTKQSSSAYRKH